MNIEKLAGEEFDKHLRDGTEAFFHFTDRDIWIAGFVHCYELFSKQTEPQQKSSEEPERYWNC